MCPICLGLTICYVRGLEWQDGQRNIVWNGQDGNALLQYVLLYTLLSSRSTTNSLSISEHICIIPVSRHLDHQESCLMHVKHFSDMHEGMHNCDRENGCECASTCWHYLIHRRNCLLWCSVPSTISLTDRKFAAETCVYTVTHDRRTHKLECMILNDVWFNRLPRKTNTLAFSPLLRQNRCLWIVDRLL